LRLWGCRCEGRSPGASRRFRIVALPSRLEPKQGAPRLRRCYYPLRGIALNKFVHPLQGYNGGRELNLRRSSNRALDEAKTAAKRRDTDGAAGIFDSTCHIFFILILSHQLNTLPITAHIGIVNAIYTIIQTHSLPNSHSLRPIYFKATAMSRNANG